MPVSARSKMCYRSPPSQDNAPAGSISLPWPQVRARPPPGRFPACRRNRPFDRWRRSPERSLEKLAHRAFPLGHPYLPDRACSLSATSPAASRPPLPGRELRAHTLIGVDGQKLPCPVPAGRRCLRHNKQTNRICGHAMQRSKNGSHSRLAPMYSSARRADARGALQHCAPTRSRRHRLWDAARAAARSISDFLPVHGPYRPYGKARKFFYRNALGRE